jgi:hypothetical protein
LRDSYQGEHVTRSIVLLALIATPLMAQSGRILTGELEQRGICGGCRLTARFLVSYGSADDTELIPDAFTALPLRDGRLLVGHQSRGPVLQYSSDGAYAGVFGSQGDGPGEYRNAKMMISGPGDSVTILGSNMVTILSTVTGRGRSASIGATIMPDAVARLSDTRMVYSGHYPRSPAFTLLGANLSKVGSFGPVMQSAPDRNGNWDEPIYRVADSRLGGFWAAKTEYIRRIERWMPEGRVVQHLDSVVPWFPRWVSSDVPQEDALRGIFTRKPQPRTSDVREDATGLLWVLGTAADRRWKPVNNPPPLPTWDAYRAYQPPADPDRHVDAIIDLIDVRSGSSIGAWRFHQVFHRMFEDGIVIVAREDDDGVKSIEVWRLELHGR